jgi:hypothetical protein
MVLDMLQADMRHPETTAVQCFRQARVSQMTG